MVNEALSLHAPFLYRIYSVWFRHVRVYSQNLLANAFPPFVEPIIFLIGIGLGLGRFVPDINGQPFVQYLAIGIIVTPAMFTAAYECTFGTFIRLKYEKIYDGMLAAPLTAHDLLIGEILWAGTKGFFFSSSVLVVVSIFGILNPLQVIIAPLVGFLTASMFATIAFIITSIVDNLEQFNFFFTGFIEPMFFLSGVVFPIEQLPDWLRPVAEVFPLTHPVRLLRAYSMGDMGLTQLWDILYCVVLIVLAGWFGMRRLRRQMVD
ncbi:ABC-2 type transporter [Spirochaeta thermophila DSM 6578]|uniref:Transport permease protein n=1 Tax=Winmispira thermophila (strain ATCC 700085 / DSM 6578 / Z-1203) TaxID=869211 RepID=G0GEY8_WINT7|nr:ABC transporter permease [Spirochaeta thermophila]AEJ62332.1 ABC-2 type transporter [Spirochaeta thermophila DSM 6578]